MPEPEILAAGAVVFRKREDGTEVLLVHRPKYDDWSFPKGKLDPGEHAVTAAVREVAEETGLDVRLGPPLPDQEYDVGNGRPHQARALLGRPAARRRRRRGYRANAEVDEVAWVDLDEGATQLTYLRDREHPRARRRGARKRTTPLVVLRHARGPRRSVDRRRPGAAAVPGRASCRPSSWCRCSGRTACPDRVSSSSRRCWTTLAPYAEVADVDLEVTDDRREEDATEPAVARRRGRAARPRGTGGAVHAPAGAAAGPRLRWGCRPAVWSRPRMLVVHHRSGQVVATEQHDADPRTTLEHLPGTRHAAVHVTAVSRPARRRSNGRYRSPAVHQSRRSLHLGSLTSASDTENLGRHRRSK